MRTGRFGSFGMGPRSRLRQLFSVTTTGQPSVSYTALWTEGSGRHLILSLFLQEKLGLSKYMSEVILGQLRRTGSLMDDQPVPAEIFAAWWSSRIRLGDAESNFFHVVKDQSSGCIVADDLRPFMWAVVHRHPGLEILDQSVELKESYVDTVLCRIFYFCDRFDSKRIHLRDLRQTRPSLVECWRKLDEHDDINDARDYFCYLHFHIILCKFRELVGDGDTLLDRDRLMMYNGFSFSHRCVDRIFSEEARKFTSPIPGTMSFEDFAHLIMSDEDKTTETSLRFWFKIVDLDGDGFLCIHDVRWFFEEQLGRANSMGEVVVPLHSYFEQLHDMLRPASPGKIALRDFMKYPRMASAFFSMLVSLNKLFEIESQDLFSLKRQASRFNDWDMFCQQEHERMLANQGEEGATEEY
mmetsp:Transcript_2087/g.5004  ORF Transcript_2087/g.5004 Transcript_2087/m.5004 type:complete len:411 (-) Transcript_2087:299-1531(-)